MPEPQEALEICSKCQKSPRAAESGSNPWCKECRAEYQREYVSKLKKQNAEQAFARGAKAMRSHLADRFDQYGVSQFSGMEIAQYIRQEQGPKFED